MAITFIDGRLRGPNGREADLRFLVDSGAVYSLVPEPVWRELAIERLRTETFSLADGTLVERDVGQCMLDLGPLGRATTPVILGQADDEALLGAVTLESLGLVLNPFKSNASADALAAQGLRGGKGRPLMAITFVSGALAGPAGVPETLDFLVDSGATYTVVPERVWRALGLIPRRVQRFRLADGTTMERQVSAAHIYLGPDLGYTETPVILGQPGDQALLGAVTLEELGLVLNPLTRSLHPASVLMA